MFNRSVFTPGIIGALAAHFCLLSTAALAQITLPTSVNVTRSYMFLPVGIGPTETMQVNVVNTAQASTAVPTGISTTTIPAPSCSGTISFLNSSGAIVGTPAKFTVASGQVASATLPYGSAGVTGGARAEIRAEVQLTAPTIVTPAQIPACSLSYAVETFDTATGATHVYVPGAGTLTQYLFQLLGR
jgi:hypothetical protein